MDRVFSSLKSLAGRPRRAWLGQPRHAAPALFLARCDKLKVKLNRHTDAACDLFGL